jgi:hypothetical protein
MKDRNVLAIKLELLGQTFKLASIIRSVDKSFYIAFPSKGIKTSIDKDINSIKFSYHTTGKTHMKMAHNKNPVTMLFKESPVFNEIKGIIPTHFHMSFWDINTINNKLLILDESKSKSTYENIITLKAENYKHIAIIFFLKQKGVDIDSPQKDAYKEVHILELEDIDLVIGVKDKWTGKKQ